MLAGIDSLSQKLAIQLSCSFSLLHSFRSCFLIIIIFFNIYFSYFLLLLLLYVILWMVFFFCFLTNRYLFWLCAHLILVSLFKRGEYSRIYRKLKKQANRTNEEKRLQTHTYSHICAHLYNHINTIAIAQRTTLTFQILLNTTVSRKKIITTNNYMNNEQDDDGGGGGIIVINDTNLNTRVSTKAQQFQNNFYNTII